MKRKLVLGSDHAGYELKSQIQQALAQDQQLTQAWKVEDLGTFSTESCDYPLIAENVAHSVLQNPDARGLLICGTGLGMSISANKISGIRAGACSESYSARMLVEHNQGQILCLGARVVDLAQAMSCLTAFLDAKFDTENPRHARRVHQIQELEREKENRS